MFRVLWADSNDVKLDYLEFARFLLIDWFVDCFQDFTKLRFAFDWSVMFQTTSLQLCPLYISILNIYKRKTTKLPGYS